MPDLLPPHDPDEDRLDVRPARRPGEAMTAWQIVLTIAVYDVSKTITVAVWERLSRGRPNRRARRLQRAADLRAAMLNQRRRP